MERRLNAPLDGRHALVTGGSRGIGYAIAERLLRDGASVTLLGRDEASLDRAAQALAEAVDVSLTRPAMDAVAAQPSAKSPQASSARVAWQAADVADPVALARAFAAAAQALGPVGILVNNAGQARSERFDRTDAALWESMLAVNLSGPFHCIQAALPGMLAAGWGRIVNVASTAGQIGYPYVTAYCAAKHGVIGLTRALALETATTGVTVNAVCPGYTETPLLQTSLDQVISKTGRSEQDARAALQRANPQKRFIEPDEVAHSVLWLVMPESGSITGQSISISGGEVM